MSWFSKRPTVGFDVELCLHELTQVPLAGIVVFAKWKLKTGSHSGFTEHVAVVDNAAVWEATSSFPVTLAVKDDGTLKPCIMRVSIRQETRGNKHVRLGVVEVDLSEFASTPSTTRRFLLEESTMNSALRLSLRFRQTSGDLYIIASTNTVTDRKDAVFGLAESGSSMNRSVETSNPNVSLDNSGWEMVGGEHRPRPAAIDTSTERNLTPSGSSSNHLTPKSQERARSNSVLSSTGADENQISTAVESSRADSFSVVGEILEGVSRKKHRRSRSVQEGVVVAVGDISTLLSELKTGEGGGDGNSGDTLNTSGGKEHAASTGDLLNASSAIHNLSAGGETGEDPEQQRSRTWSSSQAENTLLDSLLNTGVVEVSGDRPPRSGSESRRKRPSILGGIGGDGDTSTATTTANSNDEGGGKEGGAVASPPPAFMVTAASEDGYSSSSSSSSYESSSSVDEFVDFDD